MKSLLLVTAILSSIPLTATAGSYFIDGPSFTKVKYGTGGRVSNIVNRYFELAETGSFLIIDGPVASADAFGSFGYQGDWCYTRNAIAQFHAASIVGIRADNTTEWLTSLLPEKLAEAFRNDRFYHEVHDVTNWTAEFLDRLIPEYRCDEKEVESST